MTRMSEYDDVQHFWDSEITQVLQPGSEKELRCANNFASE